MNPVATDLSLLRDLPASARRYIFFADFLQYVPIQRQIGHQALQPLVLVTQLLQLTDLQNPQVRVALIPDVERRLADPHLPADIPDCLAHLRLLERIQDLFLGTP
jgi:hypothetical protein